MCCGCSPLMAPGLGAVVSVKEKISRVKLVHDIFAPEGFEVFFSLESTLGVPFSAAGLDFT